MPYRLAYISVVLGLMVTVTLALLAPPALWQVTVYVDWAIRGLVALEPLIPVAEKLGPVTAQLVTCVALHVINEVAPDRTRVGDAEMDTVGLLTTTLSVCGMQPALQ
jgi:hypothetical protein